MENTSESVIMKMFERMYEPERYDAHTDENIAAKKCLDDFFASEHIEKEGDVYDRIMYIVTRHYETTSPYIFKCGFILGMKLALETFHGAE